MRIRLIINKYSSLVLVYGMVLLMVMMFFIKC